MATSPALRKMKGHQGGAWDTGDATRKGGHGTRDTGHGPGVSPKSRVPSRVSRIPSPVSRVPYPVSRAPSFPPQSHRGAGGEQPIESADKELISAPQQAPEDPRWGKRGIQVVAEVLAVARPVARYVVVVKRPGCKWDEGRHECPPRCKWDVGRHERGPG